MPIPRILFWKKKLFPFTVAFFAIPVRVFWGYYAAPQYNFSSFTVFYHPCGRIPVLYLNYVVSRFAFRAFFWFSEFWASHFPLHLKASFYIHMLIYFGCSNPAKDRFFSPMYLHSHYLPTEREFMNICRTPIKRWADNALARRVLHRCMLKQDHLPPDYNIQYHQLATPSSDLPVLLLRALILILNLTHWHYAII